MIKNQEVYIAIIMSWIAVLMLQMIVLLTNTHNGLMTYFYVTGGILTGGILGLIKLEQKYN